MDYTLNDKRVKIHRAALTNVKHNDLSPGQAVITKDNLLHVVCLNGCIEIVELQLEGKKDTTASAFVQGQVDNYFNLFKVYQKLNRLPLQKDC